MDGVFAIAMTVLALELVGQVDEMSAPDRLLGGILPHLFAYGLSFVILSLLWMGHNLVFNYLENTDRAHAFLTLGFLLFAAAVPFPAALVGREPDSARAVAVYGVTLAGAALMLELTWWYAARPGGLMTEGAEDLVGRVLGRRLLIAVGSYVLGVAIAVAVDPRAGLAIFAASHILLIFLPVMRRPEARALPDPPD